MFMSASGQFGLRQRTQLHWCKTSTEPKVVKFNFNPLGVWFRCYRDDVMLKLTLPRELLQNRKFDSNPTRKINEAVETASLCNRRQGFCFLHTLNNSSITVSGRFVSVFTGDVWKCSVSNSPGKNLQGWRAQRVAVISNTNQLYTMRPCFDCIAHTVILTEEICNLKAIGLRFS